MIFEKIREELEDAKIIDEPYESAFGELIHNKVLDYAIEIVNGVEAEYNNGWVPCSERLPEDAEWVLCYGKNRDGEFKYEVSNYVHEIHCWMCSRIAEVIAWQPLPQPPKGE